ncbi:LamG-like jellyroll fold domain-containing protein [Pedobacter sp. B4-66]|uniref:LamG-like jellyroll fold domain-containing protein n=1 Tax=Pedobacter sp. B4-66 TaxID=2817280 RepID=UPI001BD9992A|nr:LamG-like jellyroll fold domain-containing protein [Pedobacter sp. B4-66]
MRSVLLRLVFTCILSLFVFMAASAQSWMNGYNYRKKITIDKSKVSAGGFSPYIDLIDFPVLIELEGDDLKHISGYCGNKVQNIEGRDISFALSTAPSVPLSFQLERYDAVSGKITCWVRIPSLSAQGTASVPTSIYLYYGSVLLHEPYSVKNLSTWSADYSRVWHMDQDLAPTESRNVQSNLPEHSLIGSSGMTSANYLPAKLNGGLTLNGISEFLSSGIETANPDITISAWIKFNTIGSEQVILTNESVTGAFTNGYRFSINSSGQMTAAFSNNAKQPYIITPQGALNPNTWYYVAVITSGSSYSIFVNKAVTGGRTVSTSRLGAGGAVNVGSSKAGNQYFNGFIDELRIQKTGRSADWLHTEYLNQSSPSTFYTVGPEEYSSSGFSKFISSESTTWNLGSNWGNNAVPENNAHVIITAGKTTIIPANLNLTLGSLILEEGASLTVNGTVNISCITKVALGASINLGNNGRIEFGSDVVNNGSISSNQTQGTLAFSGGSPIQKFSGNGTTKVHRLENKQLINTNTLIFETPVLVTAFVELNRGILNANGRLTLVSNSNATATVLPVLNLNEAGIIGNVNVQTYISGAYPSPATARGWRLLSSPVYTLVNGGIRYYGLNAFKSSIYITGKGGSANGFDSSPQNGGTVYTHDQSLPGTLSQKYVAIPNTGINIPLGKGIYVFSRGYREAPNAYANQIQAAPFSNPSGYTITHTGLIFTGDLTVEAFNKNMNTEGEGFNLIGNPYPAPLQWGNLHKENLSPFVWLFDPLNNAYVVSNSASTVIPSGAGFFVKVLGGNTSGLLKIEETSKYTGNYIPALRLLTTKGSSGALKSLEAIVPTTIQTINNKSSQLTIQLKRGVFEQQYTVSFAGDGLDALNDKDAIKIGEGYVSIASLVDGTKLSFDERESLTDKKEIQLYTKGWASGSYCLNLQGLETFAPETSITLNDKYLNLSRKISASESSYCFSMDEKVVESWGTRFTLTLEPTAISDLDDVTLGSGITLYPNPISNKFYLKSTLDKAFHSKLTISNTYGKVISIKHLVISRDIIEINVEQFAKGIYLVSLFDKIGNKLIRTFKVLIR